MPRKIIQDVLKKKRERIEIKEEERIMPKIMPKRNFVIYLSVFFSIFVIFLLGWVILKNFSIVLIKITPDQNYLGIDTQLKAVRGGREDNLKFEIIQLEKEETSLGTATGISSGEGKASGQIVIYNEYSSQPQKLVSGTRFETPDGKIYRIKEIVSVPGYDSLEVTVYADKAGPEYNIGLTDFTLPGLAGSPRYEKVYARSKTEMRGGFKGTTRVVSENDINKVKNDLKTRIEEYLFETTERQKPQGYVFYKNSLKIDFIEDISNLRPADPVESATANFKFTIKARATGFLLKEDGLAKVLADEYIKEKKMTGIKVANLKDLDFNLLSRNLDDTEISFNLKGNAHFVWPIDLDSLINDLMALKNKDYNSVFKKYPTIERANMTFKPSWWQMVPNSKDKIKTEIIY